MSNKSNASVATMGIDIGKNSFHVDNAALVIRAAHITKQRLAAKSIDYVKVQEITYLSGLHHNV